MIIKTSIGKGFGGCVNYVMGKDQAEVLHVEGVRMDSPRSMINDFSYQKSSHPELGKAVWHASFSFHPSDRVTSELMKEIAQDYAKKFGFDQYTVIRHHDTKHEHFHFIGNRVKIDGKTISDQFCAARGVEQAQKYERRYGLICAMESGKQMDNVHKLNTNQRARYGIYNTVKTELKGCRNLGELQIRLQKRGIELHPHTNSSGVYGVSFKQGKYCFKGSELGKDMTAKALEKSFAADVKLTPSDAGVKAVKQIKKAKRRDDRGLSIEM